MPSQEEIYQKVSATLVEALNVDEDEIKPTSTLQGDLGAESIDFLDIVFRLEREFGIKIPRGELFPEAIFQGDPGIRAEWQGHGQGPVGTAYQDAVCRPEQVREEPGTDRHQRPVHGRNDRSVYPGQARQVVECATVRRRLEFRL